MTPTSRPAAPSGTPVPAEAGATAPGLLSHAAALLSAMDHGRDPSPETVADIHDIAGGWGLQEQVNRLRLARGEQPMGFKVGFTNRTIWDRYGVFAPIWAPVWDTTVVSVDAADAGTSGSPSADGDGVQVPVVGRFDAGALARRLNRPRLEPEIVLGLRAIPQQTDLAAVAAAVDWVAHGFELVQSPWPDWKFHAGQAIASQSLHGGLLVGPRRRVRDARALASALSNLAIELHCDDELVARGRGTDVLDGPVHALSHWLKAIQGIGFDPAVRPVAGMLVTTGTLTDAQPIRDGDRWRSRLLDSGGALTRCLDGPLVDLDVNFGDKPPGGR